MKKILATILSLVMIVPLFIVGSSAAPISADTSWYDASKSEYVITSAAQLMGIASVGGNYSGKTIKLGADITLNEGDAASWATTAPATVWNAIPNFAGTFDGQGHTVSGLYYTAANDAAMFKSTAGSAVIKDFRLVNSYFATLTGNGAAGVSAGGGGTFERIYCNAIVKSAGYNAGGIFSTGTAAITVRECWFDGKVDITVRYAAGIVGNGNFQTVLIENCLNTGEVYTVNTTNSLNSHIAGICGRNDSSTTIVDCFNAGFIHSILSDNGESDVIGSIFGSCARNDKNNDGTWISIVNVYNSWATEESCIKVYANNSSAAPDQSKDCTALSEAKLTGYNAYYNTTLDFENYWAVDLDGTPVLQYFADEIPELYDLAIPEISDMQLKADGHWGARWEVSLDLPEGYTKDDVSLGLLAVPTKAIPADTLITAMDTEFEYRGNVYPVANAKAEILRDSDDGKLVATFVITDFSDSTIRYNYTVRPYATYIVEGGEITLNGAIVSGTFYTEAKLTEDETLKAQLDEAMKDVDAAIGEGYVVSRDWGTQDVFEQVPAMIAYDTVILPAEDKGLGEYTIIVDGTEGQAVEYVELLQKCGFELKYSNQLTEGVGIFQLTKGDLMVTVNDIGYQNKTFISAIYDQPLSPHLEDNYKDTAIAGKVNTLTQREPFYWGDIYIIQLKNGHFIVIDGATEFELEYVLDYLEELTPAGEKPVIEAWCNTHMHYDHFHILDQFNKKPEWIDRVYVEGFYFNEPSDGVKDLDKGVYPEIAREREAISKLKNSAGETPEIYRTYIGQRYYFCDITMDILLSQQMIPLADYKGGFNDSSNWYKFTMDGQTFIEGGDGHQADMKFLILSYDPEDLECDFFSILHHGYNTWNEYTDYVGTFHTLLFPSSNGTAVSQLGVQNSAVNQYVIAASEEYFIAGDGSVIFYLPYTVGKVGTDGGVVKLPLLTSHHA